MPLRGGVTGEFFFLVHFPNFLREQAVQAVLSFTAMWDNKNDCKPKPCKMILMISGKNSNRCMTFKDVCQNIKTVLLSLTKAWGNEKIVKLKFIWNPVL